MSETRKLNPEQTKAIRLDTKLAKIIKDEHPEIKNWYARGLSYSEIVDKLSNLPD